MAKNEKTKARAKPEEPPAAAAEIIMNPENGAILHAKNADIQRDPASLTKLMTAYTVMKAIKEGRLSLDQQITISEGAAALNNNTFKVPVKDDEGNVTYSSSIPAGSRITIREALNVMPTSSANGIAKALGEAAAPPRFNSKGKQLPGRESDFAREMTEVAQNELGMKNSSFINASGLNNGGEAQKSNLSTARDMAILAQRLMKDFPEYEKFVGAPAATSTVILPTGEKVRIHSATTNHYVRDQAKDSARAEKDGFYAVGPQKTGYNAAASTYIDENGKKASSGGIGLLTTSENKDGVRMVSVVLGARNSDSRYAANRRNLRNSYAKLEEHPELAVAYNKPDKVMLASISPSAAFAEASKRRPQRAERSHIARDEDRPHRSFRKASRPRRPVEIAALSTERVDLSSLKTSAPEMSTDPERTPLLSTEFKPS